MSGHSRARAIVRSLALVFVAVFGAACSPWYVMEAAANHAEMLAHRRSIEKALKDPKMPPELRAKLETAESARRFAFQAMGLKKSSDFSTYVMIGRPAVTYLVSASPRTALAPHEWWFPIAGSFPYKGYFDKKKALRERDRLEREENLDAAVSGAAAYKTPLPFSDPLPSSALDFSTGALAALLIHEFTHGTVYFKSRMEFNEALADFVGRRGAQQYLAQRFGPDSRELADYRKELADEQAAEDVFGELYDELHALYSSRASDQEKLARRQPLFDQAQARLQKLGFNPGKLNNAVVTANRVYHSDLPFDAFFKRNGGDWRRFIAALKSLDKKDPSADLRRKAAAAASPKEVIH